MTIEELTEYAKKFLADKYGFKLAIPIERNNRLTRTLGQYISDRRGQPLGIELSGRLLDYGSKWVILDTLKHELIHYAVHCLGENFDDGAEYFENELHKHGVGSTGSKLVGRYFLVECEECGKYCETRFKSRVQKNSGAITKCCNARFELVGEVIYDGVNRRETMYS